MSYRIINGQMYSVGKVGQGSTLQEKNRCFKTAKQ